VAHGYKDKTMKREEMLAKVKDRTEAWDILIIGGGATGVGTAIEAASRGYQTLLLEQSDFGKGTSSRSTKLIHGGVRYLRQGNISLVLEALKERGILYRNAPHLVHNLPFVVPSYDWWEGPFYGIGLKLYDMLAGKEGFGPSKILSKEETIKKIPTIETKGLHGGVIYYDGQFDDARLVINMVRTAADQGSVLLNYFPVKNFIKRNSCIAGVIAKDIETGIEYEIASKVVINATGVFTDSVCRIDDPHAPKMIQPSQGVHLVLDKTFLPGDSAIMIPQTDDGRVLFAIPWHDRVIVGTTDTPVSETSLEPRALPEEIDFLLSHAAKYLEKDPTTADVLSIFAGLRPLVSNQDIQNTAAISRDHTIHISGSGLVSIAGGKWTTYRKMAQDTIDQAAMLAELKPRPSISSDLNIHGYHKNAEIFGDLEIYGSDAINLEQLLSEHRKYNELLHPQLPIRTGEIIWAVRHEMARSVEDFLARRTRALLLDARASIQMAPKVAEIIRSELRRSKSWRKKQIQQFEVLANGYLFQ
jgi:glycerol-3-phosphate dehydrogenase